MGNIGKERKRIEVLPTTEPQPRPAPVTAPPERPQPASPAPAR